MNAREASFLALMAAEDAHTFIYDAFEKLKPDLSPKDLSLAYEMACGVMRLQRLLDFMAKSFTLKKTLPAKKKERILLRLALYQCYYLPRIPLHAIGKEMVEVAKQNTSSAFANFMNAIIRKVDRERPPSAKDFGITYSYPDFFVNSMKKYYGAAAESILERQNRPTPLMARIRGEPPELPEGTTRKDHMLIFEKGAPIGNVTKSPYYYIQNITQPTLVAKLASSLKIIPTSILDLCAAPGGKTVLLHDLFPKATLFANDISEAKIALVKENLDKFDITATLSSKPGETISFAKPFDLVVVDAPCSNSGVLYKCPEARWRLSEEAIHQLRKESVALLLNAKANLKPGGKIWFLTCSILPQENEELLEFATKELGLVTDAKFLQLPNDEGYEGGFAAQLSISGSS